MKPLPVAVPTTPLPTMKILAKALSSGFGQRETAQWAGENDQ
jgi:hypothetical protein